MKPIDWNTTPSTGQSRPETSSKSEQVGAKVSDTPETDALINEANKLYASPTKIKVLIEHARKLECQRNQLLELCEAYVNKHLTQEGIEQLDKDFTNLKKEQGLK